jgi:hypothetical protein
MRQGIKGKAPGQAKQFAGGALKEMIDKQTDRESGVSVLKKKLEDFDTNVECIRLTFLRQGTDRSGDDLDFPVEDLESDFTIPKVADFMRDESR